MRVLAAMSGGVDSSVAAALVKEEGHEVIGVTLKQWEDPEGGMPTAGCCTLADSEDARRVAAHLDIPYYVFNYVEDFRREVVDRFGADYLAGRTPNPCVECNRRVRFSRLLRRAAELGCELLVTGHYARVRRSRDGGFRLLRGRDPSKDQSYVLYMLGQDELARVRLPVGEMSKDETRRVAARMGLRTAGKPDSQDICFVGNGDYRDFLAEHFPDANRPGPIVDRDGTRVGTHQGVAGFTVGQRRGLGVALGERRYVSEIRPSSATVVLGDRGDLLTDGCRLEETTFVSGRPPDGEEVEVQVRYRSRAVPARIAPTAEPPDPCGGKWTLWFDRPQPAVAPGQAAVLYRGEDVLGGGMIVETDR